MSGHSTERTSKQFITLRLLLVLGLGWSSWLLMMLTHELGHVLGAVVTGGTVQQVVWHPAVISRTDVHPNPHPLIQVWAGPVLGCAIPVLVALLIRRFRMPARHLVYAVAGFCLIANGVYIGAGVVVPVGDAMQLVQLGTPTWIMGGFGIVATSCGLWIWHRVGPKLSFHGEAAPTTWRNVAGMILFSAILTVIAITFGNRGSN